MRGLAVATGAEMPIDPALIMRQFAILQSEPVRHPAEETCQRSDR
jgi:hypothetical protein